MLPPRLPFLTRPVDPLLGSCGVETLGTPEYRSPPRYHTHPTPADLRMDAWRGSSGIYQQVSWRKPTWSCKYFCYRLQACTNRCYQLSDVAEGLRFLHSRNIVHGDLKGVRDRYELSYTAALTHFQPNILVDDTGHARITDFGLARVIQDSDTTMSTLEGQGHTARWTAPEILGGGGTPSKEGDVFAFAMVMVEV